MWQALARYAVKGPAQGALLAITTLLLVLILPPFVVISNALVALVWLRHGPVQGAIVVAISLLTGTVFAAILGNAFAPAILMVSFWLPVIVMAQVLRKTVSLNLAIVAGAVLALVGVVLTYLLVSNPAAEWQKVLDTVMRATEQAAGGGGADTPQVVEWLSNVGTWMTGFSAATQFLIAVLSLLLARVWQARMFNPGGLQKEFHGLRFGLAAGLVGLAVLVASVVFPLEVMTNLAVVVIVVFALQGMAVVHALTAQLKLPAIAMVGVYGFLFLLAPSSVKVIGLFGLADTWLDFRSRLSLIKKE